MNATLAFVLGLCVVSGPLLTERWTLLWPNGRGRPSSRQGNGAQEQAPGSSSQQPTPDNQPPADQPPSPPETKPQEQPPEKPSEDKTAPATPNPNPNDQPPVVPETPPPAIQETKPAVTSPRPKSKASRKRSRSRKIVVRDGGTSEPTSQLSPLMSPEQADRSKQTTSQLLSSTEANLKRAAARALNDSQETLVEQIKKFVEQSNAAVKAGDYQRGHNLAMKALLLSDDLLKH